MRTSRGQTTQKPKVAAPADAANCPSLLWNTCWVGEYTCVVGRVCVRMYMRCHHHLPLGGASARSRSSRSRSSSPRPCAPAACAGIGVCETRRTYGITRNRPHHHINVRTYLEAHAPVDRVELPVLPRLPRHLGKLWEDELGCFSSVVIVSSRYLADNPNRSIKAQPARQNVPMGHSRRERTEAATTAAPTTRTCRPLITKSL